MNQLSQVETADYRSDPDSLRSDLISFLFEVAGIRGVYSDLHRDVMAFKSGFMLQPFIEVHQESRWARVSGTFLLHNFIT
jgi:hypothetical protein